MIMGFDGTALDERLRTMLTTLQPGGVILFKRNIEERRADARALARHTEVAASTAVPLR